MGAVNPLWHRWVYASVAKHLHTHATAASVALVVEFLDKRLPAWSASAHRAEALITGPMTKQLNRGLHRIWVDVFITLTSDKASNNFVHVDKAGAMASALDQCIRVMDYGATGLVEVGILRPIADLGRVVDVQHLKPGEKDETIHSTIQSRFYGLFSEN